MGTPTRSQAELAEALAAAVAEAVEASLDQLVAAHIDGVQQREPSPQLDRWS